MEDDIQKNKMENNLKKKEKKINFLKKNGK